MTREFFATVPMPFAIYTLIVWGVAFIVVLFAVIMLLSPLVRESIAWMRETFAEPVQASQPEPARIVTKVALHRPRSFREPAPKGFDARRPYLRAIAGGRQ